MAAFNCSGVGLEKIVCVAGSLIASLVPIVMVLALLYFFWGLAKFILAAGNEGAKAEGKNIMIWGVVALFVMVSVWGLVAFLQDTFGVNEFVVPTVELPTL